MGVRVTRAQRETLAREYGRTSDGDILVAGGRSTIEALEGKGLVENVRTHPGTNWVYAIATLTEAGLLHHRAEQ